jgi:large subunit ribosomal protein L13
MATIAKKVRKQRTLKVPETVHTVDAEGRTLGRVASTAAAYLLGKKSVQYVQNKVVPVRVTIINAKKIALPEKRVAQKSYRRYSGYPGGLYETSMDTMLETKGIREVLRRAVDGMIPRNKLRKERMKRLTIKD